MGLIISLVFISIQVGFVESDQPQKQRAVYHVNYDDASRQAATLRNIRNHLKAVGADKLELRVVLHGKGLSLLLTPERVRETKLNRGLATPEISQTLTDLRAQGVTFNICANTMKNKQVQIDQLSGASSSDVVPSGIAAIAQLQDQGYAYLRP